MKLALKAVPPVVMVLLFGGCGSLPKVGPDYQPPPMSLPSAWVASAAVPWVKKDTEQTLRRWWMQFGDPQLNQLIEQSLMGSLDLKLAQARLLQARASQQLSEAGLYPTLSASVGGSHNKSATTIAAQPARTLYDAGFDAAWEVDVFGGNQRALEAANADLAARQANLDNARVSLVAEVARNYIALRANQQRLVIARNNLTSQTDTFQITQWRYQAGLARASEVDQAKAAREQTRASLPDLEISLVAAENRLAVLLGRSPGELHQQLATVKPLPQVPEAVASGIPAQVLRQRPDLIAAERALAAETARVGQKMAQRFPSLTLSGSFGWQAYRFATLGGADTITRALGGTLAATLFDGGRLRSQVAVQSAVQEQALISYQSSVLTALEEVENALKNYAVGRERLQARQAAADAARHAAVLTRQLYQSGLVDFPQVLETQRTQLNAEDSLITAEASLCTSLITLYKALGGGWDSSAKDRSS